MWVILVVERYDLFRAAANVSRTEMCLRPRKRFEHSLVAGNESNMIYNANEPRYSFSFTKLYDTR